VAKPWAKLSRLALLAGAVAICLCGSAAADKPGTAAGAAPEASPLPTELADPRQFWRDGIGLDGSLSLDFIDIAIPARGWPLVLSRGYQGDQTIDVGLGKGWGWSFGVRLRRDLATGRPEIIEADGGLTVYAPRRSGDSFHPILGRLHTTLLSRPEGGWIRFEPDGRHEVFSPDGLLIERRDPFGVAQRLAYDGTRLIGVDVAGGRHLSIEQENGRTIAVVDPLGRRFSFVYADGRLVETRDPLDRITRFTYGAGGRLTGVALVDSSELAFKYDGEGRVIEVSGPGYLDARFTFDKSPDGSWLERTATDRIGRSWRQRLERLPGNAGWRLTEENPAGEQTTRTATKGFVRIATPGGDEMAIALDADGDARSLVDLAGAVRSLDGINLPAPAALTMADGAKLDGDGMPDHIVANGEEVAASWDRAGRPLAYVHADGRRETFTFDDGDRLVGLTDRDGTSLTFAYDPADRQTKLTDTAGATLTVAYDAAGLPTVITRATGELRRYTYDEAGQLTAIVAGPSSLGLRYDAAGRPVSATDESGNQSRFTYDARGLPSTIEGPRGSHVHFKRDANGALTAVEDSSGRRVRFTKDGNSLIASEVSGARTTFTPSPDGTATIKREGGGIAAATMRFDAHGRIVSFDPGGGAKPFTTRYDASGRPTSLGVGDETTSYSYDDTGRPVRMTSSDGVIWEFAYTANGHVARVSSSAGEAVTLSYDARGELTRLEDLNGWQAFQYGANGRVTSEDGPDGSTTFSYGPDGLMQREERSDGRTVSYVRDNRMRLVAVREAQKPIERVTRFSYDRFGDLATIDYPDGQKETYTYDSSGRLSKETLNGVTRQLSYDAAGRVAAEERNNGRLDYHYDPFGRLVSIGRGLKLLWPEDGSPWPNGIASPRGGAWRFARDGYGRIKEVTDPQGGILNLEFDGKGRPVGATDPGGRRYVIRLDEFGRERVVGPAAGPRVSIEHDGAGRAIAVTKASGARITTAYDGTGRLTRQTVDGREIIYRYDQRGRLTGVTDEVGEHEFVYDDAGRVVSVTDPFGRVLRYAYDRLGRRVAVILPEGDRLGVAFDAVGRVAGITGPEGGKTTVEYDALNQPVTFRLPGVTVSEEHEVNGSVGRVAYADANGGVLVERKIERDDHGDIAAISDSETRSTFTHDLLGRLVSDTPAGAAERRYAYDGSENRTEADGRAFSYDDSWRLSAIDGRPVEHDVDGNLTRLPDGTTFSYDALGRVVAAKLPDGRQTNYRYDYRGRLVERVLDGVVRRYLWDGDLPIAVYDGDGKRLVLVERLPASTGVARLHGQTGIDTVAVDVLGTPIALIGADGAVAHVSIDAWGVNEKGTLPAEGLIGFTGLPSDPVTGLVFTLTRAYLPSLGRFLSPDPAGWQEGLNPYVYSDDAPLEFVDRNGRQPTEPSLRWQFGPPGTGLQSPHFPLWPDPPALAPTDPLGVHPAVLADLEDRAARYRGTVRGQIAQETLDLIRDGQIHPSFPVSDPNFGFGSSGQPALGRVRPNRPLMPEAYPAEHGMGRVPRIRNVATTLVHEVTHSVQYMRGDPRRSAVWEFEAYLRDSIYEPRSLWSQGSRTPVENIVGKALVEGLRQGQLADEADIRAIRRILQGYAPHLSERSIQKNVERAYGRFLADELLGQSRPAATGGALSRAAAAATEASAAAAESRGLLARLSRVGLRGALAGAGAALGTAATIYYSADMTDQYIRGEIDHVQYWGEMTAMAGSLLVPWPFGAAIGAAQLGKFIGQGLAQSAIAAMNDPNNPSGKLLKWLFQRLGWINANDPTFLAFPARPPPTVVVSGPPAIAPGRMATIWQGWFERATFVDARILGLDGATVKVLPTEIKHAGRLEIRWDGRNDRDEVATDGTYRLVLRAAWQDSGLLPGYPRRSLVRVDSRPPAIDLSNASVANGRLVAHATIDEPASIAWLVVPASGSPRLLTLTPPTDTADLDVSLDDLDVTGPAKLVATATDGAGNQRSAEADIDLAAFPSELVRDLVATARLEPAEADLGYAEADILPAWIAGNLPQGAKADGDWRWSETTDPRGARTHISDGAGTDTHVVFASTGDWYFGAGDRLVQYVKLDAQSPPRQIVLQIYGDGRDGEHRLTLGEKVIDLGAGPDARLVDLGEAADRGEWLRVSVPAEQLGLVGRRIEGFAFISEGGRAFWGTTTRSGELDDAPPIAAAGATRRLTVETAALDVDVAFARAVRANAAVISADGARWPIADGEFTAGHHRLHWRGPSAALAAGTKIVVHAIGGGQESEQSTPASLSLRDVKLVARIDLPIEGSVGRQTIPIFGQAGGTEFSSYRLEARGAGAPPERPWTIVANSTSPALMTRAAMRERIDKALSGQLRKTIHGNLGSIETGSFNHDFVFRPQGKPWVSGGVDVRLTVFGRDGSKAEDSVAFQIGEVADGSTTSEILSADGKARLKIPPLAMPFGQGALAIESAPATEIPPGLKAAGPAYTLLPTGARLDHPAMLTLPIDGDSSGVRVLAVDADNRRVYLPAAVTADRTISVPVSVTYGTIMPVRLAGPPVVHLIEAAEGSDGLIVGFTTPLTEVTLVDPRDSPLASTNADADGGFTLMGKGKAVPGGSRLIATDWDGRSAVRDAPIGPRVAKLVVTPDMPADNEELSLTASLATGQAPWLAASLSGADGNKTIALRRDGDVYRGTVVATGGGPARIALGDVINDLVIGWRRGPPPPKPVPVGLAGPIDADVVSLHRGKADPNSVPDVLVDRPFALREAPTFSFRYRFTPAADVVLLFQRANGVDLIDLTGKAPDAEGGIRVRRPPPLTADGAWHTAVLHLSELLADAPGQIESVAVGHLVRPAWRTYHFAGLKWGDEAEFDSVWIGRAWPATPAQSFTLIHPAPGTRFVAWSLEGGPKGDISISNGVLQLALPRLTEGWHSLTLRAAAREGQWGPAETWPVLVDMTPPRVAELFPPPDGETSSQKLSLRLTDDGSGPDIATVRLRVDNVEVPEDALRFDGTSGRLAVDLGKVPNLAAPLPGAAVTASLIGLSDRAGNSIAAPVTWSWRMATDEPALAGLEQLTRDGGADAAWFPDGKSLVYIVKTQGRTDLFRLLLKTGKREQLTTDGARKSSPSIDEEGRRLVYESEGSIVVRDLENGSTTIAATTARDPAWMGERIVAAAEDAVVLIDPVNHLRSTLCRLPSGGLVERPRPEDGQRVVFTRRLYQESLWACRLGGEAAEPVSLDLDDPALVEHDPVALPTDDAIIFADGGRRGGLWMQAADGSRVRLTEGRPGDLRPSLSVDGARLVFDSGRDGRRNLWLLDIARAPAVRAEPATFAPDLGQTSRISIVLKTPGTVGAAIVDGAGTTVANLRTPKPAQPGTLTLQWNGRVSDGAIADDGGYAVRVTYEGDRRVESSTRISIDTRPPQSRVFRAGDGREIGPFATLARTDSVRLAAEDGPFGSGVALVEYRESAKTRWQPAVSDIPLSSLTTGSVFVRARDRLGHVEDARHIALTGSDVGRDITKPPSPASIQPPPASVVSRQAIYAIIAVALAAVFIFSAAALLRRRQ
jgi:RHS repeat-associated protein